MGMLMRVTGILIGLVAYTYYEEIFVPSRAPPSPVKQDFLGGLLGKKPSSPPPPPSLLSSEFALSVWDVIRDRVRTIYEGAPSRWVFVVAIMLMSQFREFPKKALKRLGIEFEEDDEKPAPPPRSSKKAKAA